MGKGKKAKEEGPRIVAAVGSAVAEGGVRTALAEAMQQAETRAVQQAIAEGVGIMDTEELLKRKAAARQAVRDAQR